MERKPLVSNLSLSFRKSRLSEDNEEVKREHRTTLHHLIQKYQDDVESGKAEGIRNAKDLIEVMKMDLLLMGEADSRTENMESYDEVKMTRLTAMLDEDDPQIQQMMEEMLNNLNDINDDEDVTVRRDIDIPTASEDTTETE